VVVTTTITTIIVAVAAAKKHEAFDNAKHCQGQNLDSVPFFKILH